MRRLFLYLFIATISFLSYSQPVISDADWFDQDLDGQIDRVVLTFDVNVDITDATPGTGAFDVILINGAAVTYDDIDYSNTNQATLTLNFTGAQLNTTGISGLTVTYQAGASEIVDAATGTLEISNGNASAYTDSAAPQITGFVYQDNDLDGRIDRFSVSFSEALDAASVLSANDLLFTDDGDFDGALFGTSNTNLLGAGAETSISVVFGTEATVADTEENSALIAVSTQNGFSLTDGTNTNSTLAAQTQAGFTDGAGPVIISAVTSDNDLNGQIDRMTLTFSENIDDVNSGMFDNTTVDVAGYVGEAKVSGNDNNAEVIISFTESGSGDTGATPNVTLLAGQVQDASTISIGSSQVFSGTTDGAAPQITDFEYQDNDNDGMIDRFVVSFSEALDAASSLSANDLLLSNVGDFTSAAFGADATDLLGSGGETNITVVLGTASTVVATEESSGNIAISTQNAFSLSDGTNTNNTTGAQTQATFSDGAGPVIISAVTSDNDLNGQIDRMTLTFSENIDDGNSGVFDNTTVDVAGYSSETKISIDDDNAEVIISFIESGGGDTGATPNVTLLSGQVEDASANSIGSSQVFAGTTDGAAPQITDFEYEDNDLDGRIDQFVVSFSETLDATSTLSANDLFLSNVGDFTSAAFGADMTDLVTAAVSNVTVVLGTESTIADTEENLGSIAVNSQNAFSLTDGTNTNNTIGAQGQASFTDGAAPQITDFQYQDNDLDGRIDRFLVSFSEALDATSALSANDLLFTDDGDFNGALFGGNNTNLLGAGGETNVTVVFGTEATVADTEENSGTIAVNAQNGFSLTDGTNTNSTLAAQTQASFTDGAGPVIISVVTSDNDLNGQVDRMTLTFSENIDDVNSGLFNNTTVDVAGYVGEAKVSGNDNNAEVIISFTESGSGDTGATPNVTLLAGQVQDASTISIGSSQVFSGTTDGAAPQITDFEYQDNDNDGRIDQFIVSFSEALNAASNLSANDLTFSNDGDFNGALFGVDATNLLGTGGETNVTVILGTEATVIDTEENSASIAINSQNAFSLTDGTNINNTPGAQSQANFSDGAAPIVTDLEIFDTTSDGFINQVDITFSENVDTDDGVAPVIADLGTLTLPDGEVVSNSISAPTISDPGGLSNQVSVTLIADQLTENTSIGSLDINGLTGFWEDASGNAIIAAGDDLESLTDSANPALISSFPADNSASFPPANNLTLTFSETVVFGTGNITLNNVTGASTVDTYDVGVPDPELSLATNTVTINPVSDLTLATEYALQIAATAIDDGVGNSYVGILNNDDLDFVANNTAPVECTFDYQTNFDEPNSGSDNGHLAPSQCNTDPASISSLIDTQTEAVNVFHYHLHNGNNGRENVTSVTIRRGAGDDIDWSVAISDAILIDENGQSQAGVISSDNIAFTSIPDGNGDLGDLPGNDDGDDGTYLGKEYALRIWFNSNLGAEAVDIDGKDLIFELSTDDMANVDRVSIGGANYANSSTPISTSVTVNVVATEYAFLQQPSNASATAVMTPTVTLEATDENGNRDLDYDNVADAVQITSTGSLSPIYATPSVADASDWASGIGTVSEIVHNTPASARELNTTSGALTNAPTSTTFEITADVAPPVFLNASYFDTDGDGDIDEVAVEMGEEIDETTAVPGDFVIGSGTVDAAVLSGSAQNTLDANDNDQYFTLQVTVSGTEATTLAYTQGSLRDVSANLANSNGSITTVDVAAPVFIAAHFFDSETVNGVIDEVVIEMSEPIEDGSIVAADFSIGGAAPTLDASTSNSLDPDAVDDQYFTLQVSLVGTSTFSTSYTAGSLTDIATNSAVSDGAITETDRASPVIINSLSLDTDTDGNTDAIELEFSENVKDITFSLSISDWTASSDNFTTQNDVITDFSSEVTDLAAVNVFDDQYVRLEWSPTNTSGTGAYQLRYTNGGDDITDNSSNANAIANITSLAITDGALPVFLSANTRDNDGNGYLDGILVRFSDVIDVAGTLDESSVGGFDDFSITGGYTITAVTPVAGAGVNDDEIILTLAEMASYDTDATPDVTVNGGELDDTDANTIPGATLTAIDNADPVFISGTTDDSDSDGQIDEITILFSEDVDAGTIDEISAGGFDDFSVTGYTISAVTPLAGSGVDDNEIVLTITQSGSNDTGATPDVTVSASQVDDLANNTAATATIASIDGAPILITDATWNDVNTVDGNIDQVVLTFSESVDISDVLLGADGFDGIQINAGANAIDMGNYSANGVTALTLNFDGSPITGTGISGQSVAYVTAGTNDITEAGGATEMQNATAPLNNTDNATPIANSITISSNNTTNNTHAITGNTVTLAFTVDDDFSTDPTVTFKTGGANINNAITVDNSSAPNYEATFDVNSLDTDGLVTFTIDFTDDGGNAGTTVTAVSDASSVTVDNTAPTLTITRNAVTNGSFSATNDNTISFDLAFSEVMDAGFDFNDISRDLSGVTTDVLTAGSLVDDGGGNYTLTVTGVNGDGTLGITVSGAGSPDPAGNTLAGNVTSSVFTIDNTAPTVTINRNAVSSGSFTGTNDASVSFDIAFSTPIDNSTFVLGDVGIITTGSVTVGGASLTPDGDNQNYTFTIPVTGGDGDVSVSMAVGSIADAATNGLGGAVTSSTITIDNTAPTASNVTIVSNNTTNTDQAITGNTVTLSFTVDDDLTGNPTVAFRSGGAVINNTVSNGGSNPNYTASYLVDAADEDGNVTFTLNFTDDAGNAATQVTSVSGSGSGSSVNVDNTIPTLTITRNAPGAGTVSGTNSNSVSFDLAFSEVMDAGFDFNDISRDLSGVTTDALTAGSLVDDGGGNYTLTVTGINGDGTLGITVSGAGSPDPAGNTLAGNVTSSVFTIDNTAPTATLTRNAVSNGSFAGTNDASVSFDIAFSTPIDNSTFVLSDVTINNPGGVTLGAASLTPDGDNQNYTYSVPVTSGDGNLSISMAAGSITDAATNGLGSAASSGTITIDNTAPTSSNVSISSNNGTNNDQAITGNTVTLSFTVNDDLTGNPTVAFRSGGVSVAGAVTIGGSNPNYTASYDVDASDREGNVTFTLNFTDDAGNAATQVTSVSGTGVGTSVNVDNTIPTLTITRNTPAAGAVDNTNSNSVSFDLAFSEVMDAGFTFNDISLNLTGVTANALAASSLVNDGGGNYTLTVSNVAGDGTLGITVSGAGSPDPAGNTLAANVVSSVFTIDNTAPTLQSASVNSSTSITLTLSDNAQVISNSPGDFSVTDIQGTSFTVTGVADGTAGDADLVLTVNDFSGSVGDLTVTYASSSSNYADLSTNQLADDATGLLIERDLNVSPSLTENSTGLSEDTDSDVAMYRTNTTGVETSTPIDITPNITGTSTITIYSDAGLSTMVHQETNVSGSVSPALSDFFPSVDFSDGNADHGIYTFYITETATNSTDSEGPSVKYSIAFLDDVTLSPNLTAFSEDDDNGTTLTITNHPSDQTLTFTGNGLTDFDYGSTTSDVRFVPSSAGNANSPHDIRFEFENAAGETANFIAQTLVVNSANNVFNTGQTTSFCRVDGIEVINVNSNPSGIDTGEDGDTSQPDFFDVEVYYIKNGSVYTNWKANSEITTGVANSGNIARIVLPYDRNGDDADDRDDGTLGVTAGTPTFAASGIWKINPNALTDDLFDVATDRASIDTLRFIYYATNNAGTVTQQVSQVAVYFYPDPVVEISSSNDVVCEDEDPFALTATLNGVSVTVDSYEISLGGSTATITSNLFNPANPLNLATAPNDPSGNYEITYTSDLSDGGNGCTDTDMINIEVFAKPDVRKLSFGDTLSNKGVLVGNLYTLEYCEGETFDDLSITLDGDDEIRWYTNSSLTTELDIVDGNSDGSLVRATDFFGISEVQGGEDEDFFYVYVNNLSSGGVCQSDAIQVRFIGHSTPDIPEADLTSSTAGGMINTNSVEYNYCQEAGVNATIEDIILNPLPTSGEAYFTVLAADTVLFAQLTNTTMEFDSLLTDLTPGASHEFEILIVDYDNSFPATEPSEGVEFTGCASDTLKVTINVFEIPGKPVPAEFADNPNEVNGVITYYMCQGEELPDISINPPNGVNEYLYEWSLTSGGSALSINDNQGDRLQATDYNNSFGVDVINTPGTYSLFTAINANVRDDADFTGCTSDTTQVSLIVYPNPGTPTVSAPTNTSIGTLTGGFDYSFNYCVDAGSGLISTTPFDVTVPSSAAAGNDERLIWFTASDDGTAIANANPVAFGTNVTATNLGIAGATNETFEFAIIHNTDIVPGYDDFEGCFSDTVFVQVLVSTIPATQFRIDGITAGETSTFSFFDDNASIIATDGVVFEIRDASNTLVDGATQSDLTPASFSIPSAGQYTANLSITTSAGCERTEIREFQVLEKIIVNGTYTQDFESSNGGWFGEFQSDNGLTGDLATPARQNSWAWGTKTNASQPDIVNFTGGAEGTSTAWHTNLSGTYQGGEESYVYSPAFDITALVNPALSMYTFRSLDSSKDGVVMQYSTDDGETWKNIGNYDPDPSRTVASTGNNWYTENGISSAPGDLTVGWGAGLSTDFNNGDVGWANQEPNPDSIEWKQSVHALEFDATDDISNVRFRFALGASGAPADVKEGLGFSFDQMTIFQLDRNVIVEQFSSLLSADSRAVNNAIRQSTPNVLAINYFTGLSNSGAEFDQLNRRSKSGPAARSSYYGIDRVPSSVLDGELYPKSDELNWDENDIEVKSIQPTKFLLPLGTTGVRIDNNGADDQRIEASISFVAQNSEAENLDITFHFALVEKEVLIADILAQDPNFDIGVYQTDDILRNVLRVMLPDAAGFSYKGVVNPGQSFDYTIEWNISNVYAPDELRLIAYVQDRKTKQVLQAGWGEVNGKTQLAVGLDDQLSEMDIYPNPADKAVTLEFVDPIVEDTEWVIFDQAGREVLKGEIARGTRTLTVETEDVPSGLYFIHFYAEERKRQSRRVLILH